jgi:hydrogenase maturation protease
VSTNAKNIAALGEAVAPERQIVIAVIGVDWPSAGDPVARLLGDHELPSGVSVHELGTGALDIAYDVMRGYDAAVLIDVSPPTAGSADVTEADEKAIDATIEDGQELNPHAMDVPTVLHFIKHTGGWPGKVMLVGCDPAGGDTEAAAAVDRAFATIEELRSA